VKSVTLYTRNGCCLCTEALNVLETVRGRVAFELSVVDISTSRDLELKYLERIPVVLVDSEEFCEYQVNAEALENSLRETDRGEQKSGKKE